jgi:hypothetical protein
MTSEQRILAAGLSPAEIVANLQRLHERYPRHESGTPEPYPQTPNDPTADGQTAVPECRS